MENIGFSMFDDETILFEKRQNNTITTKEKSISFFQSFFL